MSMLPRGRPKRLRWWHEVLFVLAFYAVYSTIRNLFGSAAVSPERAKDNADLIIDIERAMGLYFEERLQHWFLPGWDLFFQFWNIFYGTFHFIVTAVALIWLFRARPERYPVWRNTLAFTTAFALVGFATFPLMPPRLLHECPPASEFGGCDPSHEYVDTLKDVGGLWSFDSKTMQEISNQYAAMPSLHFAWSTWSMLVLLQLLSRRWMRGLAVAYPWLTLFAIVVTANHYWIDAAGGALVLGIGYLAGRALAARTWALPETAFPDEEEVIAT